MSIISRLGPFISRGCDVSEPVLRRRVTEAIVDTMGCMLVGARSETVAKLLCAFAQDSAGAAPVFGTPLTLTPAMAALVNGASAHAWDLDDWEDMGNTHPSAALVPALIASVANHPRTGAQVLQAYATGFEVIARLGEIATTGQYQAGFHVTGTLGALGAAAAVANLMELEAEDAGHAVALAASQAMGLTAQFGSDAKALHAGLAAKAGVLSVQMAKAGMRGKDMVLDGPKGFFAALCPDWAADLSPLQRLGQPSALLEGGIYVKRYPSCAYTHRLISCAEEIAATPGFDAAKVISVEATLPDFHRAILPYRSPQSASEALFSLEFCLAQTLCGRSVSLQALEAQDWQRADCAAVGNRTQVRAVAARNPDRPIDPDQPDVLKVACGDRVLLAECAWPLGAPSRPLGEGGLVQKFDELSVEALLDWVSTPDIGAHLTATLANVN